MKKLLYLLPLAILVLICSSAQAQLFPEEDGLNGDDLVNWAANQRAIEAARKAQREKIARELAKAEAERRKTAEQWRQEQTFGPEPVFGAPRTYIDRDVDGNAVDLSGRTLEDNRAVRRKEAQLASGSANNAVDADPAKMFEPPKQNAGPDYSLPRLTYTALPVKKPHKYAKQDLVTIVIRENHSANSASSITTEKEHTIESELTALPKINLGDLFKGRVPIKGGAGGSVAANPITTAYESSKEYEADGNYSRNDTITTRVTGRVIDIRPNGLLVLEAKKTTSGGGESTTVVLTGTCRPTDIDTDNTIVSTRLADLKVRLTHNGELKKNQKKGSITEVLDFIFNF